MAKKKPTAPTITAESIEDAIRGAVWKIPGIQDIPETDYCALLAEACAAIMTGCQMRASELKED